jgi:signal transduction histidine kinase
MRIRSQFIISIIFFGVALLVVSASMVATNWQLADLDEKEKSVENIQTGASDLGAFWNNFLLFQEDAQLTLWETKVSSISNEISKLNSTNLQQKTLVNNIWTDVQSIDIVFNYVVSLLDRAPGNKSVRVLPEFETAWSQMVVQDQALAFDASVLHKLLNDQHGRLNLANTMLILTMFGLFGTYFLANYLMTYRSILKSISTLQAGTAIVGSGNLEYRIKTDRKDEVGELAIAFNQMANNLKRASDELVRSEKFASIGQLASAIAHEIRNPLGVIKNSAYFLNLMLKDVADEKVVKHLKILDKKVNSANLIISDLLDFARKKPPTLDRADLNETVSDTLSCITVPENVKVEIKLGEIPKMLLDKEQVQRVCQNLVSNAVQAMPEGGKLTIETREQGDSAKLIVRDTGVGIPKENVPKLYMPLFSTKAKGIGLGLVICKQIVEGHDGNITVESRVGEGSTFTVTLPIRMEKEISEQSAFSVPMPIGERVKSEE